jgi:uncharacterized UBP type Zn finger protein
MADGTAVTYQLVSYVKSVYDPRNEASAHYVAIVRKESAGLSWILFNDARIVRSWRATVRDGWLRDSVRFAVYVRQDLGVVS